MTQHLTVHDWEQFQQYKDDRPLHWIKLHVEILENYKISKITDEEFGQIAKIWLLAARMRNKIPNDPIWIKEKASLRKKPNISKFIELGFIELNGSVESRTISYGDSDMPVRREEKSREEKSKRFVPPTLAEVQTYFKQNGYTLESAEKAFKFYDAADWVDSKGNKVKSWKQKMVGVWFKPENKRPERQQPRACTKCGKPSTNEISGRPYCRECYMGG